ncbi:MAG: hypothetical protein KKA90_01250 [Nanoarchaeota archaeon]|nr:hypothetical protein [Nanoarchaeota archaeon]
MKGLYVIVLVIAILVIGGIGLSASGYFAAKPSDYDGLAKALTENGVKMYGTFWCGHCQAQKAAFGPSWQYIDYVECSLPDRSDQTQACKDAGVNAYPTWMFPDGTTLLGEQSMQTLADKIGYELA